LYHSVVEAVGLFLLVVSLAPKDFYSAMNATNRQKATVGLLAVVQGLLLLFMGFIIKSLFL